MAEKTPKLNLAPEQSQVLSSDFNLFYQPDTRKVDPTVDRFLKELDGFNNNVVYKNALLETSREKKTNEAEAIKSYNENKIGFQKAVEKGLIPKEANPYFAEKYQELEMESKAQAFKEKVYSQYYEKSVADNPLPNAFDNFYKDELKKFIKENGLGNVDPLLLNNAFFKNTSATRNQLSQTHVSTQASKLAENHKIRTKESFQIEFGSDKSGKDIGIALTEKIKGLTTSGLSRPTARKYLLESIVEYAQNTGDPEAFKSKLTQILQNINLGTDSIFNVKSLQDDFDAIDEALEKRIDDKLSREISIKKNQRELEYQEAIDYVENYPNFAIAKDTEEFQGFSQYKQDKINDIYKQRAIGYGTSNDPDMESEIDKFLTSDDFEGAYNHLVDNQTRITQNKYQKLKEYINQFKIGGKDGLLADDDYEYFKNEIGKVVLQASKFKISNVNPFEEENFEKDMISWIARNKEKYQGDKQAYIDAFRSYANQRHLFYKSKIQSGFVSGYQAGENTTRTGGKVPENVPDDEAVITKPKVKADLSKIK